MRRWPFWLLAGAVFGAFFIAEANALEPIIGGTLPPPQYDHPFRGKLIVKRVRLWPGFYGWTRGSNGGVCTVYVNRALNRGDAALLVRHETGHCNGWSADHRR